MNKTVSVNKPPLNNKLPNVRSFKGCYEYSNIGYHHYRYNTMRVAILT